MKKTNAKTDTPTPAPTPAPAPAAAPTEAAVPETNEDREARVNRANQAIREVLQKENCTLMVPMLDISSGRVFPQIQVVAQQAK